MSMPCLLLRITFCLLAVGALARSVRCEEPKPDRAAALADLKKYDCRGIGDRTAASEIKRLAFGCHSKLPDAAFAHLAAFPELEKLDFISNKVTDACLGQLKHLPKLTTLCINSSTITDQGLESLKGLPLLEELQLMRTKVTDKGLATVRSLGGLKRLSLIRLKTTPALIEQLKQFKNLDSLIISQTTFTDQQKRELTEALPNLSIK